MSKKDKFIEEINQMLGGEPQNFLSSDAFDFWNSLQVASGSDKPLFTENGKLVLQYMKDNEDSYNNFFKAKDIGEGLSISSRTVSGAMRKLINDGYVEKMGADPTVYAITSLGEEVNLT